MKIFIASDHAGYERKQKIIQSLKTNYDKKLEVHDEGPFSAESVDYPDFANRVCHHFKQEHSHLSMPVKFGILICGSGQGMCMRANKYPSVRAALCWSQESAKLAREHNDANVLCLGARLVDEDLSLQIVQTFISTPFAGGRHSQRVVKLSENI